MNDVVNTSTPEGLRPQIGKKIIDITTGSTSVVFVLEGGGTILIRGNSAGGLTVTSAIHAKEKPLQTK